MHAQVFFNFPVSYDVQHIKRAFKQSADNSGPYISIKILMVKKTAILTKSSSIFLYHMMCNTLNGPLCNLRTMKALISLRISLCCPLTESMETVVFVDKETVQIKLYDLFVCVEVLQPSQPNGVMSSVVSLTNHTFTGQA